MNYSLLFIVDIIEVSRDSKLANASRIICKSTSRSIHHGFPILFTGVKVTYPGGIGKYSAESVGPFASYSTLGRSLSDIAFLGKHILSA